MKDDKEIPITDPRHSSNFCIICKNQKFYEDNNGIWHECPKCKNNIFQDCKPLRVGYPPSFAITEADNDGCLFNGLKPGAYGISCPCPKCSPRC